MAWLEGYRYRRAIKITEQSGNTLSDYQTLVDLTNYDIYSANNGIDVRFTDADGNLLNYWREEYSGNNIGSSKKFWVKVPSIPASSNVTIYVYYGNSGASDASNGTATFLFFDGFSGTNLDTNKWVAANGSLDYSVENGYLRLNGTRSDVEFNYIYTNTTFGKGIAVLSKVMTYSESGTIYWSSYLDQLNSSEGSDERAGWRSDQTQWWVEWNDGSNSGNVNISGNYATGSWHRLTLILKSDTTTLTTPDGSLTDSHAYPGPGYPISIGCSGKDSSSADVRFDFVAIRQYVDPEPALTIYNGITQNYIPINIGRQTIKSVIPRYGGI